MNDPKTLANLLEAMGGSLISNLGFIPDDKFDWKPAPTANSALEIANHILGLFHGFNQSSETEFVPANSRGEAQTRLRQSYSEFVAWLRAATPEELDQNIPFGDSEMPLRQLISIGVVDTINHHGQITYIQTLLGDTEDHFDEAVMPLRM